MRLWNTMTAISYIQSAKHEGLTYWSAWDYLKQHAGINPDTIKQMRR